MSPPVFRACTFVCVIAFAVGAGRSWAQATIDACARRDTLLVMPMRTEAEVAAWRELRERLPERPPELLIPELERWFRAADTLHLVQDQLRAARRLVDRLRLDGLGTREYMWYADYLTMHLAEVEPEERFGVYNSIGNAKEAAGDLATALRYFVSAYKAAHPDSTHLQIYGLGNMAYVYLATGDTASAKTAFESTVRLSSALANPQERYYNNVYDYCALGDIYRGRGLRDSADYYYRECTTAFRKVPVGSGRYTEVEKLGRSAIAYTSLFSGDYLAVDGQLDTLRGTYPEVATLLEVRMLEQTGHTEQAYEVLAKAEWHDDQTREECLEILIRLGRALGHHADAVEYAAQLIVEQRREVKQARQSLSDLSTMNLEAFERERLAVAQRHADELALMQSRQRAWLAICGLLFALLVASWAWRRYRRSHRRSESLSEIVDQQNLDLTEANLALETKVRELVEFNHLLSHDLREPLRSISGFSKLLRRRITKYPELTGDFAFLTEAIDQLNALHEGVEHLRKTRERRVASRSLDLVEVVEGHVESFRAHAPQARVAVRVRDVPAEFSTDPVLLQTILWELLDNAAKFSPAAEPRVLVEVYASGGATVIAVEDEGIGVEANYQAQVFEVFKRLNRREEFAGAGMGLAVAKTAAARLGAELSLARSAPGEGSRFVLSFPPNAGRQAAPELRDLAAAIPC